VDAGVASVIAGDGFAADVVDVQVRERRFVELEAALIGGENQDSTGGQKLRAVADQANVVALNVEVLTHALGV